MGNIFFTSQRTVDNRWHDGNIVGVLHATFARDHIADTVKWIGAQALLKESRNLFEMHHRGWHIINLTRLGIHRNRYVALNAVIHIFPNLIIAHSERDVVSSNLLRRVPVPSCGAVAIVDGLDKIAAANGFFVVGRGDKHIIGGLVREIVHAGEPSLAKVVRLAVEAHTEVIDIIAPPFYTTPSFVESVTTINDVKCRRVAVDQR